MDKFILQKDHLTPFLRKLGKEFKLVAPLNNRHGDTMFGLVTGDVGETAIDLDNQPQNSIKPFLLPQREVLFNYRTDSSDTYSFTPATTRKEPTIYFGVRSCDLSAILYMDVVFLQNNTDSHYLEKRVDSLMIGLNCNQPFPNCFCNATRHGPFLEYGSDLQLTDLGDRFLVEAGRSKGEDLINKWQYFLTPATEKDIQHQYQAFLESRSSFRQTIHVDQVIKRLHNGEVDESVWAELSLRCQDCGGCAYVCPTCTCFTVFDQRLSGNNGERVRAWDACTFSGFTRMAGGHNPVNSKTAAIRQRFMHKLHYDVKKHGRPSCVGCGRCVNICFGGTDIIRFIDKACREK